MRRFQRTEDGILVEGLTFGMILAAARAYRESNKNRQQEMGMEELITFQILCSALRDLEEEINNE